MFSNLLNFKQGGLIKLVGMGLLAFSLPFCSPSEKSPNILFVITDDQSFEHVGCYGDQAVRTPAIDRLAGEGVRFTNAYCAAPSCSPSRAGILTGQDIYRLEEGGILTGFIRNKFQVFPLLLEEAGYFIGNTGKPYWPRTPDVPDTYALPIGKVYAKNRLEPPAGISRHDYAANFEQFLDEVPAGIPFFFWVGIGEPHLPHPQGLGAATGIDASKIRIPSFYPEVPEIRSALSDYLAEIEWADRMLGKMIRSLEVRGWLENTVVVFTSDNGMPFPRAKATLYDFGVRMPLIVQWPQQIKAGRVVDDPVNLIDLAPTFLELAGIEVPRQMTGRSLTNLLASEKSGRLDKNREFVVTAFEKHTLCREGNLGFPRRALHTEEWTYIRNYEPDRWPAGGPNVLIEGWGIYGDIDPSGIKAYFTDHREEPDFTSLFELSFGKVPKEELYNKIEDPDMIHNLASDTAYQNVIQKLRRDLENYLRATHDPRMQGKSPWDRYNLDDPPGHVINK